MRQLATVQIIADVQPIPGADAIEKVKVKDWWCVAKKGEFAIGDKCVYFEIDSLLPSTNPMFEFLAKGTKEKTMVIEGKEYKGYRLKTIKLRGQLSQGLALPASSFSLHDAIGLKNDEVGTDISEYLGIVKYEPPIPAQLAGKVKGFFPSFLIKTDEERVQNLGDVVKEKAGTPVYITEKLDGSSVTIFKKDDVLGVCSRNLELLETEGNSLWKIANQYDLKNKLPNGWAIQGEIVGEGIQNNPLKLKGQDIYVFNFFNIARQEFMSLDVFEKEIEKLGMKTVPVILRETSLPATVDEILVLAEGSSAICPTAKREGIVIRPIQESTMTLQGRPTRFSFKAISNEYLLSTDS